MNFPSHNFIKKSLFSNQLLGGALIFAYCAVYGITAQVVLTGLQLMFFLSSMVFALTTFYLKDLEVQKARAKKGILFNQIAGTVLVFAYLLVYGISSAALLSGFQMIFFMSSFTFVMSIFYLRDPERIKKEEEVSSSSTHSPFVERHPCFINNQDMSWLIRSLNGSLCSLIGFSELMLKREYNEREKEFMLRSIYEQALSMSHTLNKVSEVIPDPLVEPKQTHEVVDDRLLVDKKL